MKKIGIFGGSFDPVHHAHLILAREALEMLALDEILFIPAAQSPHKSERVPADAETRWEMLLAAIEGERAFIASRLELDRPPPSYSIETIERLREQDPKSDFFFLVGEDNLPLLGSWHRFAELERLVHFVVLDRTDSKTKYAYPAVRRRIDISATAIRKRVASGQSIRYLVPDAVEEIIRRETLYQGPTESNPKN
ncbi:MAG: nicotinate (nicotinamide) nucleotide adenylyltransferase [Chthoniobacterales bacterium]|nr:nicotinate (nicotinamide) nucleotide adenylyltransferase [Chthoniobacterales bacterium]